MSAYPGFSREALELIHLYESYGWTFTVSSKGHAIGHAPSGGETCSIARRLAPGNRALQRQTWTHGCRSRRRLSRDHAFQVRYGHGEILEQGSRGRA